MTRAEIAEKLKYIKSGDIVNPKDGDCFELKHMPIKEQLLGLGEGKQKIFFLKVESANYDGEMPEINLILDSATVYISATKYV